MALMWLVFTIITILTGVFTHTESKSASYASVAFIYLFSGVHNLGYVLKFDFHLSFTSRYSLTNLLVGLEP